MNKQTMRALKGSIEKWKDIAAGEGADDGPYNCPLCGMFLLDQDVPGCGDCPVGAEVGYSGCLKTPHDDWANHQELRHIDELESAVHCRHCKTLALKEVAFLESLLP